MMPEASPAGVSEGVASSSNRNDSCDIIGSDEHLVPNIIWYILVSILKCVLVVDRASCFLCFISYFLFSLMFHFTFSLKLKGLRTACLTTAPHSLALVLVPVFY